MKKFLAVISFLFFVCSPAIPTHGDERQDSQDHPVEQDLSESETAERDAAPPVLKGRKVTLRDGREVFVVNVPDSLMKKTEVRFDKEGKSHVSCH